jgi:hypothetical protein
LLVTHVIVTLSVMQKPLCGLKACLKKRHYASEPHELPEGSVRKATGRSRETRRPEEAVVVTTAAGGCPVCEKRKRYHRELMKRKREKERGVRRGGVLGAAGVGAAGEGV